MLSVYGVDVSDVYDVDDLGVSDDILFVQISQRFGMGPLSDWTNCGLYAAMWQY